MSLRIVHFTEETRVATVEDDETGSRRYVLCGPVMSFALRKAGPELLPFRLDWWSERHVRRAVAKEGRAFPGVGAER